MTEQTPEREEADPLTTDGEQREFVDESGDESQLVDEDGETRVTKVAGEDEFTTGTQPAVSPDDAEVAMPRPGGLVQ